MKATFNIENAELLWHLFCARILSHQFATAVKVDENIIECVSSSGNSKWRFEREESKVNLEGSLIHCLKSFRDNLYDSVDTHVHYINIYDGTLEHDVYANVIRAFFKDSTDVERGVLSSSFNAYYEAKKAVHGDKHHDYSRFCQGCRKTEAECQCDRKASREYWANREET